jgi:hypothetical protein
MEEHYRISISKGQASFDISSHDKDWVEKKAKDYITLILSWQKDTKEDRQSFIEPPLKRADIGPMSPNEFYRTYIHANQIKNRPDIVTFMLYYLEKIQKKTEVTSADVREMFKQAQYAGWNKINVPDALFKAKKKAFLNSVGNFWSLTILGEDFVLNNMTK